MILELYLELSYLLSQILFLPSAEPKVYESLFLFSAAAASHFVEIDIFRTLIPLVLGFHGCLDFMDFWTKWILGITLIVTKFLFKSNFPLPVKKE